MTKKIPVYQVEVIASTDGGNTYRPMHVLTLEEPYTVGSYEDPKIVGYLMVGEEE